MGCVGGVAGVCNHNAIFTCQEHQARRSEAGTLELGCRPWMARDEELKANLEEGHEFPFGGRNM